MNRINPLPMGTAAAAGQATPAMQLQMAKAYGRRGGRASAKKRGKSSKRVNGTKKRRSKLKFGSPAWRAKYMRKGKRRK